MTTTLRTTSDGQPRKTLASQIDRLDSILDGLDTALAGAVQEAVGLAVKEAVQAVLTEVLTNPTLQEQLRLNMSAPVRTAEADCPLSWPQRLREATVQGVRWTVQTVRTAGHRAGVGLLAASVLATGIAYAARRRLASAVASAYRGGKRLLASTGSTVTRLVSSFALSGI